MNSKRSAPRQILLATAGSIGLTGAAWLLASGAAGLVAMADHLGDVDMGAGLIYLVIPFLTIPFALAWWLDRLDVRGAGTIGLLGFVVSIAGFFTLDAPALTGALALALVSTAVFGTYVALATTITAVVDRARN